VQSGVSQLEPTRRRSQTRQLAGLLFTKTATWIFGARAAVRTASGAIHLARFLPRRWRQRRFGDCRP
jgi:hypothetical protein